MRHALIRDVRGLGLFVGVERVIGRESRGPATRQNSCLIDRLRQERVLIGGEGPDDNVLKIRPPLTIDDDGIDMLLDRRGEVLSETGSATSCGDSPIAAMHPAPMICSSAERVTPDRARLRRCPIGNLSPPLQMAATKARCFTRLLRETLLNRV